LKFILD
jgi:hypothetical protein